MSPSGSCSSCMQPASSVIQPLSPATDSRLSDDRRGQHSIRVNDQYRICFVWNDGDADNVEIVDYHKR